MTISSGFLSYSGPVDYSRIDILLNDLKESKGFIDLDKETGRRVYAIVVECLENIIKYSAKEPAAELKIQPRISVGDQNGRIIIKAGNLIEAEKTGDIVLNIDKINSLDDSALIAKLKEKINTTRKKEDKGAGLGLMLIKLKSGNNIEYNVSSFDDGWNYLELTIEVNEYLS